MKFLADIPASQNLDAAQRAADQSRATEQFFINGGAIVETLLQFVHIHDAVNRLERGVVEAAFRQAPMQRHLTAFESGTDASARAGFLALVALAGCLAMT